MTATRTLPKSNPASASFKISTNLKSKQAQAMVGAINPLIADAYAVYLKTKNFHWHLSSSHFHVYHLMLDEHADQLLGSTDLLAECVRRLGGTTLRSISHISALQTVSDDHDEGISSLEMLKRLMNDSETLASSQRAAQEICGANRDYATASLLELIIDETERRTWFLFEAVQGLEHTRHVG